MAMQVSLQFFTTKWAEAICRINSFTATGACSGKTLARLGPLLRGFPGRISATFTLQKRGSFFDSKKWQKEE